MSQPSSMFVARDIIQTILGAFFLGHPVSVKEAVKEAFKGMHKRELQKAIREIIQGANQESPPVLSIFLIP